MNLVKLVRTSPDNYIHHNYVYIIVKIIHWNRPKMYRHKTIFGPFLMAHPVVIDFYIFLQ